MVGLLYALPGTRLARRLHAEGRLERDAHRGAGRTTPTSAPPASTSPTLRPRADVLADYREVLRGSTRRRPTSAGPAAPRACSTAPPTRSGRRCATCSATLRAFGRMAWRMGVRDPEVRLEWWKSLVDTAPAQPGRAQDRDVLRRALRPPRPVLDGPGGAARRHDRAVPAGREGARGAAQAESSPPGGGSTRVRVATRLVPSPGPEHMAHREDPTPRPPPPSEGTLTGLLREVLASGDAPPTPLGRRAPARSPDRPVRADPRDRTRWIRLGLGGPRRRAEAQGGLQGHSQRLSGDRRRARARRGGGRGPPLAREHRHAVRRGEERARSLPGHGTAAGGTPLAQAGSRLARSPRGPAHRRRRSPGASPTATHGVSCTGISRPGTSSSAREGT